MTSPQDHLLRTIRIFKIVCGKKKVSCIIFHGKRVTTLLSFIGTYQEKEERVRVPYP